MKHILAIIVLSAYSFNSWSQDYSIDNIPDSLLLNANAVIRNEQGAYTINGLNEAIYEYKKVVTILRHEANELSQFYLWYDPDSKLSDITGTIYDANGSIIKTIQKNDIIDFTYSGISIYQDNRYKHVDLSSKYYPYTIEISYVKKFKNLFYAPDWSTLTDGNISLVKSNFTLKAPGGLNPNFKILNSDIRPVIEVQNDINTMTFEFSGLKARKSEPYSKSIYLSSPRILVAPSRFSFDGFDGGFETWETFNDWMIALIKNRTTLPQEEIEKMRELTSHLESDKDKIKAVYNYLQQKTRYVSIQLGIGGYQPFTAESVAETGYGDCKALTNYTHSLLKEIGITSFHTLIDAGRKPRPIIKDFPNNTFNHMILCVPNEQDTIWLECTDQTNPFGYLGTFTGNRDALIITPDGGKIAHTQAYKKKNNTEIRFASINVDQEGNATAFIETKYSGLKYEMNGINFSVEKGYDHQKKWILKNTDIPNFNLKKFSFVENKDYIPSISESLDLELIKYGQSSGERLFIPLNLMNKLNHVPERLSNRTSDIHVSSTFSETDSLIYNIHESLYPEYVPEPIAISTKFGKYSSFVSVDNGKVTYTRNFELNRGVYSKADYNEFRQFFKSVKKADKAKIVFLKKT